jgi:16S rRNA (guanine(966)-N(2))-methyltransferase RsmD
MRIIAGIYKGKTINDNKVSGTHPMSEKLRGAIYNALGDVSGLRLLDGCAGTGMVGFEGISRGITDVDAVEKDDRAFADMIRNSHEVIGKGNPAFRAYHSGIRQFMKKNHILPYDIMIFDPPYDMVAHAKINIVQMDHFDNMYKHLNPDGIVIFSLPSGIEAPRFPNLEVIRQKTYGVAQLIIYKSIA